MFNYADGLDVFKWPEFEAFAKRLGIPLDVPLMDLVITLPGDGYVPTFKMNVQGQDKGKSYDV